METLEARTLLSITPGDVSSFPSEFIQFQGTGDQNAAVYFAAQDGIDGQEIWKYDGTQATLALNIGPLHEGSGPQELTVAGDRLYFTVEHPVFGRELWSSDGTMPGTLPTNIYPGSGSSSPRALTDANGTLYFLADDGVHGHELWKIGTDGEPTLVRDIFQGDVSSDTGGLTAIGDWLFVTSYDFDAATSVTHGHELWVSDGTEDGTYLVGDIRSGPESSYPEQFTVLNGDLYFSADDGTTGRQLWKASFDGGTETWVTAQLTNADGLSDGVVSDLTVVGSELMFTTFSPVDELAGSGGLELWRTDGTGAGTVRVAGIRPGERIETGQAVAAGNRLVFPILYLEAATSAYDETRGWELWAYDATGGAAMIRDFDAFGHWLDPFSLTAVGDTVFFPSYDSTQGHEPWRAHWDGAAWNVAIAADINPTVGHSFATFLTNVGGTLYFGADDGVGGVEPWKAAWSGSEWTVSPVANIGRLPAPETDPPQQIQIEQAFSSDTGSDDGDQITGWNQPTFFVTVDRDNTWVGVDFNDDGTFDEIRLPGLWGTQAFTPPTAFADGRHTVTASILVSDTDLTPLATDTAEVTIDTQGYTLLAGTAWTGGDRTLTFDEAISLEILRAGDFVLEGVGLAAPISLTRFHFADLTPDEIAAGGFSLDLSLRPEDLGGLELPRGWYTITFDPTIQDLAGNQMDPDSPTRDVFYYAPDPVVIADRTAWDPAWDAPDRRVDLIVEGGTLEVSGTHHLGSLLAIHGGTVTHADNGPHEPLVLEFDGDVYVDATSRIDFDGRGYAGGDAGQPGEGPAGTEGHGKYGATGGGGGGHGGAGGSGGQNGEGAGGSENDLESEPAEMGSGGGGSDAGTGGSGGGAVRLVIAGGLTLDGQVTAGGGSGSGDNASGGAGGSVWIQTGQLAGSGQLRANGGAAAGNGGGGGGGRIALHYAVLTAWTGTATVDGGAASSPARRGGIGTYDLSAEGDSPAAAVDPGERGSFRFAASSANDQVVQAMDLATSRKRDKLKRTSTKNQVIRQRLGDGDYRLIHRIEVNHERKTSDRTDYGGACSLSLRSRPQRPALATRVDDAAAQTSGTILVWTGEAGDGLWINPVNWEVRQGDVTKEASQLSAEELSTAFYIGRAVIPNPQELDAPDRLIRVTAPPGLSTAWFHKVDADTRTEIVVETNLGITDTANLHGRLTLVPGSTLRAIWVDQASGNPTPGGLMAAVGDGDAPPAWYSSLGHLTVESATTIDGASLYALGGGTLNLGGAVHFVDSVRDNRPLYLQAVGPSAITMPNLKLIEVGSSSGDSLSVSAIQQAEIDLSGLLEARGNVHFTAEGQLPSGPSSQQGATVLAGVLMSPVGPAAQPALESVIRLDSLINYIDPSGGPGNYSTLAARDHGVIHLDGNADPNKQIHMQGVQIVLDGTGGWNEPNHVQPALAGTDQIVQLTDGRVDLSLRWGQTTLESKLDLSRLQDATRTVFSLDGPESNVAVAFADAQGQSALRSIDGASFLLDHQAKLTVPAGVTNYDHGTVGYYETRTWRASNGGVLDLSGLETIVNGTRRSRILIDAQSGGQVLLPNVIQILDPVQGDVTEQNVLLTADGAQSQIALDSLVSFVDRDSAALSGLTARNGGQILAPQLVTLQGIQLTMDGTGDLPYQQIRQFTQGQMTLSGGPFLFSQLEDASRTVFSASGLGTDVLFDPHLRTIDGASFLVTDKAKLMVPHDVTSYDHATSAYYETRTWRASDGGVLALSGLETIVNGTLRSRLRIEAQSGGQVLLPNVIQILDPVQGDLTEQNVFISADGSGSTVDLGGLQQFIDRLGGTNQSSKVTVSNGGAIIAGPANNWGDVFTLNVDLPGGLPAGLAAARFDEATAAEGGGSQDDGPADPPELAAQSSAKVSVSPGLYRWVADASGRWDGAWDELAHWERESFQGSGLWILTDEIPGRYNDVAISDGNPDVDIAITIPAGTWTVRSVKSQEPLMIVSGGSFTVMGPSRVDADFSMQPGASLTAEGPSALLEVPTGTTTVDGANLYATSGGRIWLPQATGYSHDTIGYYETRTWRASSGGVLDLSGLETIVNGTLRSRLRIDAQSGGQVLLPNVTQIVDPVQGDVTEQYVVLTADGEESRIALDALVSFVDRDSGALSGLTARNGGQIWTPQLLTLQGIQLTLDGTGNIPYQQIQQFTQGQVTLSGSAYAFAALEDAYRTQFSVSGLGTDITFGSGLQEIDGASFLVDREATLAVPAGVTSYDHGTVGYYEARTWRASGGGVLDLSGLETITNGTLRSRLRIDAQSGGQVLLPNVTQIVDPAQGDVTEQNVLLTADGVGSRIALDSLVSFVDRDSGALSGLTARNGGQISAGALVALQGIQLTLDGTGNIPYQQIQQFTQGQVTLSGAAYAFADLEDAYRTQFSVSGLGTDITFGSGLQEIDGASFLVDREATLTVPTGVTSYDHATSAYYQTRTWRVTGGGVLDVSGLETIVNGTLRSEMVIDAQSGGRVLLPNVTRILDPAQGDVTEQRIVLSVDGIGSLVDLSSLTEFVDNLGGNTGQESAITVRYGGQLWFNASGDQGTLIRNTSVMVGEKGLIVGNPNLGVGSTLSGTGTVRGHVTNGAIVQPGASPGALTIEGDYTQTAAGALVMEIGGRDPGDYDQLHVTGTAALDGAVGVVTLAGSESELSGVFPLVTFAARTGGFKVVDGLSISHDKQFLPTYLPNAFTLGVAPESTLGQIEPGQVAGGAIEAPQVVDKWYFSIAAGKSIFLDVQQVAGGTLDFTLQAPDGGTVFTTSAASGASDGADHGPVVLAQAGVYTLLVDGRDNDTPRYELQVFDVPPVDTRALRVDTGVTAEIGVPGQVDQWQFTVNANRTVTLDVQLITGSGQQLDFTLKRPDGTTVVTRRGSSSSPSSADYGPAILTQAGAYTLVVDGIGDDTAGYRFQTVGAGLPRIVTHSVGGAVPGTIDAFRFGFNQGMNTSSFALADDLVSFSGPGGPLAATGFSWSDPQTLVVSFAPQPVGGTYQMTVGSQILSPVPEPLDQDRDAVPGEATDDQYAATSQPAPIALGQRVTGRIARGYSVEHWAFSGLAGQQIRFDRVAASNAQIVFDLTGPGGWVGFQGLAGDSGLLTLSQSGTYYITARSTGTQDQGGYAFEVQQTAQTNLLLGTPYAGQLVAGGQAQLFLITVPAGMPMRITLDDSSTGNHNELYAKAGEPPTRGDYDYRFADMAAPDQDLLVPLATAGTWYVLVYGDYVPSPSSYTLLAQASPILVTDSTPQRSSNGFETVLTLRGAGFDPTTTVELVAGDNAAHAPTRVEIDSFTLVTATFSAGAVPVGLYDVRVARADGASAELADALQITDSVFENFETNLLLPSALGWHQLATIYVEYANAGDVTIPAPLLVLTATNQAGREAALLTLDQSRLSAGFWTSAMPEGFRNRIEILAGGRTPGVLQPGESVRVPVYWAGWQQPWGDAPFHFELGVTTADDSTPIDWNSHKDAMRWEDVSEAAWEPVWANVVAQVGPTWGDYVRMLNENAAYLGRLGQEVVDVGTLFEFEIRQANGLLPFSGVADSINLDVAAPGLPLTFERTFAGDTISGRYDLGPLGRGWSHNWQWSLAEAADGTVAILAPGGVRRIFQPDARYPDRYFAQPGDEGTLAPSVAGGFTLRESTGLLRSFGGDGKLAFVEDTNGNRITAEYDAGGRLGRLTHSSSQWFAFAYNAAGRIESVSDHVGRQVTFAYDASGEHLLSAALDDGRTVGYEYLTGVGASREHALAQITQAGGTHRYFEYDAAGRLIRSLGDLGAESVSYSYDTAGRVTVTTALGNSNRIFFDQRGRIVKGDDDLTRAVYVAYDECANFARISDSLGVATSYSYDKNGKVTSATDALGGLSHFTYTLRTSARPFDRLASVQDASGNLTAFDYDAGGNLLRTVRADGTEAEWTYDAFGDPSTWTNRREQTVGYTRDAAGRLLSKQYPDGTRVTYTYDGRGNLATATDARGGLTAFSYYPDDLLRRVDYPGGRFLEYTYDAAGRRTSMLDPTGNRVNYHYDAVGRLERLTDAGDGLIVRYEYDAAGRLSRETKGNGTYTAYAYNAGGDLEYLVNHAPDGSVQSRFGYTYDLAGLRSGMTTLDGQWTYEYDAAGQLVHAAFDSTSAGIPDQDLVYQYDAAGNRVSATENGTPVSYVSNNMNQYTAVGAAAYTYDDDGNLISETNAAGTSTYSYDVENRLVQAITPEGTWEYEYDALGNRRATVHNGQRTEFLLDPAGLINVVAQYDGAGGLLANYTYGLGLVSETDALARRAYYAFDAIGSTSELTDAAGAVLNSYAYDPFGGSLYESALIANPFQFVGQPGVMNEGNGLQFMRARFYDAERGRFVSEDPLGLQGGDINLYRYAGNNPISQVDPSGLNCEAEKFVCGFGGVKGPLQINIMAHCEATKVFDRVSKELGGGNRCGGGGGGGLGGSAEGGGGGGESGDVGSSDPIEKTGPLGFGAATYVSITGVLPYRVDFENASTATAPAQFVSVTDKLSGSLDWSTFELTEIGFGDQWIAVPEGLQHFETTVAMKATSGQPIEVRIEAGLRAATGEVYALFMTIDPATELPPDVTTGFLPPEDGTGRGMGYISYVIKADAGLASGTEIRNIAVIQFDFGETIATNQVDPHDPNQGTDPAKEALVTLDAEPPASRVLFLAPFRVEPEFTVVWTGADEFGGSGIANYDVFVSVDSGPYQVWLEDTSATEAIFDGDVGHAYAFYSLATDNAGHREADKGYPEALTVVVRGFLTLTVAEDSITEGGSSPATVTRSNTAGDLTVNLSSSDTNEATVVASLTILDGQTTSAPFEITAVHDGIVDGAQTVTIRASASDFVDGTATIVVLDQDQDSDSDGILDSAEDAAPGGGDGNADGVPDSQQPHVTSLPNAVDGQYVTLAAPSGTSLNRVQAIAAPPAGAPAGAAFPLGLFAYEIAHVAPGTAVKLTMQWHSAAVLNSFLKYGPTPADPAPHWDPFLFDSQTGTGAKIYADRIEVYYVDGLRGDGDLAANGIVADPGAPALVAHPWQNPAWPENVNNDALVSPSDVLALINEINARGARILPPSPVGDQVLPPFWDVDGDDQISPADVLVVINYINNKLVGEGEPATAPRPLPGIGNEPTAGDPDGAFEAAFSEHITSRPKIAAPSMAAMTNRQRNVDAAVGRPTCGQPRPSRFGTRPAPANSSFGHRWVREFLDAMEDNLVQFDSLEEILTELVGDRLCIDKEST
jgi:RHS repeat-associated protein